MFTCLECAKKLYDKNRLSKNILDLFSDSRGISYGKCEFCGYQKETIDIHHSVIKPIIENGQ